MEFEVRREEPAQFEGVSVERIGGADYDGGGWYTRQKRASCGCVLRWRHATGVLGATHEGRRMCSPCETHSPDRFTD